MNYPEITAILAVFLGALLLILTASAIVQRQSAGVSIGDGGKSSLSLAIRAQGNLIETAPIVLILLMLAEAASAPSLHALVVACVYGIARVAHAIAFLFAGGQGPLRILGALGTLLSILGASSVLAIQVFA